MVRCTCHSLQLAISHASEGTLPRNIDYMVRETYNWFSYSSKRQLVYKRLYEKMNDGKTPLSMEPAVTRILNQWDVLRSHFELVRNTEKCYAAELLFNMYSDPIVKLYLLFLRPVLQETQRVLNAFQADNIDPTKLLGDLTELIESLSRKILLPTVRVNPQTDDLPSFVDHRAYLGYEFENVCKDLKLQPEVEKNLRGRCSSFILKYVSELRSRMPENFTVLKNMTYFSVSECLRQVKPSIVDVAALFGYSTEKLDAIDTQWRNISYHRWDNTSSTVKFWNEVSHYKDAAGVSKFAELSQVAMDILSLPHSNADVERLFSQLNLVKSKLRNRLQTYTVNAILCVRSSMQRHEKCCFSYELPTNVIRKIGTMEAYSDSYKATSSVSRNEDVDDVLSFL